jgi:hypothetical protein
MSWRNGKEAETNSFSGGFDALAPKRPEKGSGTVMIEVVTNAIGCDIGRFLPEISEFLTLGCPIGVAGERTAYVFRHCGANSGPKIYESRLFSYP